MISGSSNLVYGLMYESDRFVRKRFQTYIALLQPYLKNGVKVLDIGGYTGDILHLLPKTVEYFDVDIDREALRIAQEKGAKKTYCINLEQDDLHIDEPFDIILATELLEHLKDPGVVMEKIQTLLKSDGIVLLSLPNECTIFHRIKCILGYGIDGTGFAPHYHLHFPTLAQNTDFISKYFHIIELKYWYHLGVGGVPEKALLLLPESFWMFLIWLSPGLFARGGIYLCTSKSFFIKKE